MRQTIRKLNAENIGVMKSEAMWISAIVVTCILLAIKASEDPLLESIANNRLTGFLSQFSNGNQIIFNLSVGLLVSLIIYIAAVRIPEQRRRRRAKIHLKRTYKDFKLEVIKVMISAQRASYPSNLPDPLLDKKRFQSYFKEQSLPYQNRWDIAFNNLDNYELRQLRQEFEILIEEIRYTFLAIDIENEIAFDALKRLQQISHRMKGTNLEYDDKKSLFRFLWHICSGFSHVSGYSESNYIENVIASI